MQNKNQTPYILGLDVGTNSIGWAVVDCKTEENAEEHKGIYAGYHPVSLRALNSRIFLDMLDEKQVPKNQKRRAARGTRNRRTYYKRRRKDLVKILIENGLLPDGYRQRPERVLNEIDRKYGERKAGKAWNKATRTSAEKAYCSPYAMRNFALDEKLEPHEFGRLLLHLQRRRGYFSNRGAKYIELIKSLSLQTPKDDDESLSSEEKKETGKVLVAISELDTKLDGRTLGQFIWQESQNQQIPPQRITLFEFEQSKQHKGETVVEQLQFRAEREMYEKEFDEIWQKQNTFYKLPNETTQEIKKAIFHQRPLQLQKSTVGNCNIYPRKKRTAVMRLEFQEFRTLQVINNIKIGEGPLNEEQRQKLLERANNPDKLNKSGRISWNDVAKALGVKRKDINYRDDGDSKTGLFGNRTAQAISDAIGIDAWQALSEKGQAKLVEDLLTIHNKVALYKRLSNHWYDRLVNHQKEDLRKAGKQFAPYQPGDDPEKGALGLTMNEQLEAGYGKHSLKAINEMLPHLRNGLDYYKAVEKIGGRESITKDIQETDKDFPLRVDDVPNIANPIVQKALHEIRRVINSIIKRYGKPAIIRMEMAREMKSSKKHRREIETQQGKNRKQNEQAEEDILEYQRKGNPNVSLQEMRSGMFRVKPSDRAKYKMWKFEQEEQCPYCQRYIGFNELFSGEAEIEHILPYTGFRQNYMNTVVSCQTCNRTKGKRTPYEAWGQDADRWQCIEEFVKEKYKKDSPKYRNILKKEHKPEDVEEFVERQLNDTRYIATATRKMLEKYGVPIDVNNGAATAKLRGKLGLNNVLPRDPDSGAYTKEGDRIDTKKDENLVYSPDKAKKSRQDHRHHAVDAFVVAITDRAMLQEMIKLHQQKTKGNGIKEKRLELPESWEDGDKKKLHGLLKKKLDATVVSHMTKRKVWGALHKETLYGKSHFDRRLNIEGMKASILNRVQEIAGADANDNTEWIEDENLRTMLWEWVVKTQKLKPDERTLPQWKGKELHEFTYQVPCVTVRKELTDVSKLLSKLNKEWNPGTGTWIAEKSIHIALYQWLETHNLVGKKTETPKEKTERIKKIKAKLNEKPPCVRNKKGEETNAIIRRVRIARAMTDSYLKIANSYIQAGNNHHFVLFDNGKEGKERKRRINMVTMLEAARRRNAREPVIDKKPPPEWEGEWHYKLSLCVNDMVLCEDMEIFEDKKKFAPEHEKTPYFRVQKMGSLRFDKIDLTLRHHSVSGTDSKWGKWRISSLGKIKCKKVQFGNLGLLPNDS